MFNLGISDLSDCSVTKNLGGTGGVGGGVPEGIISITAEFPGDNGGAGGNGAGIYNSGILKLNFTLISDNSGGMGGAGGDSTGSSVQGGTGGSGGSGGGIYNADSLELYMCAVTGNSSGSGGNGGTGYIGGNGGNGGDGGGIFNQTNNSSAILYNDLIASNSTAVGGLGAPSNVILQPPGPVVPITPTPIPPTAPPLPPGLSPIRVRAGQTTNTGNQPDIGVIERGGIIIIEPSRTPPGNGNPGANGLGPDLFGNFLSLGYNLIGEGDGSTGLINGYKHDIVGTIFSPANPQLYRLHPHPCFSQFIDWWSDHPRELRKER
jgi:hypothetical protein